MPKVLIVEDNKEISRMYERVFHLGGYEVDCVGDGIAATEKLKDGTEAPSLILLDVIIPRLSGIDVLRNIKADEHLKHIPVIILTNSLDANDEKLFLSLGANRYLIKMDIDPSVIVREADTLLGRK